MYWLRWHYHVKGIAGHRTKLNKTKTNKNDSRDLTTSENKTWLQTTHGVRPHSSQLQWAADECPSTRACRDICIMLWYNNQWLNWTNNCLPGIHLDGPHHVSDCISTHTTPRQIFWQLNLTTLQTWSIVVVLVVIVLVVEDITVSSV